MQWTVGISPRGEGLTGSAMFRQERSSTTVRWGGGRAPLPCLQLIPLMLTSCLKTLLPGGDTPSRTLPRVAISNGNRFTLLAQDEARMTDT